MRWLLSIVVCAALATPASADYGKQTLAADGATGFCVLTASKNDLAEACLIGVGIISPTIHLVHERYKEAGIDLGLRAAAFGATYWLLTVDSKDDSPLYIGLVVGLTSYFAIMIVDAAVLADEPDEPTTTAHIAPLVSLSF